MVNMGADLTLHINIDIPDEVMDAMNVCFSSAPEGDKIWEKLRKKYPLDEHIKRSDRYKTIDDYRKYDGDDEAFCQEMYKNQFRAFYYFLYTPSYEIGEWSPLKCFTDGDNKWLGKHYGHGDYSEITDIIDKDYDYGKVITDKLISELYAICCEVCGEGQAKEIKEFLETHKGHKVFYISW